MEPGPPRAHTALGPAPNPRPTRTATDHWSQERARASQIPRPQREFRAGTAGWPGVGVNWQPKYGVRLCRNVTPATGVAADRLPGTGIHPTGT